MHSSSSQMIPLIFDQSMSHFDLKIGQRAIRATNNGKKEVVIKPVDGHKICYTLKPIKYCKQATKVNLFLLSLALSKGEVLSINFNNIVTK